MNLQGLVGQAYPSPEWAVFYEVSNATGFGARRRADAVALGIWPSRGHTLVGFEFKEDRRDWLREKDNPAKADVVAAHCDCWYVVAGRKGIVQVEELPEPWGLYVANDDRTRLQVVKPCQPFPDRDKAIMRRSFVAAMLRKVTETTVPKSELARLVEEGAKQAVERLHAGHELKMLRREMESMSEALETFKARTGVDLRHGWQGPEKIADAVNAVLHSDSDRRSLSDAKKRLEMAAKTIGQALDAWPVREVETA